MMVKYCIRCGVGVPVMFEREFSKAHSMHPMILIDETELLCCIPTWTETGEIQYKYRLSRHLPRKKSARKPLVAPE